MNNEEESMLALLREGLRENRSSAPIVINYNYYNGPIGQHNDHVDTVNFTMDKDGGFHFQHTSRVNSVEPEFDADTPLSALFRESHHEELRKIVESWRPYLMGEGKDGEALRMTQFEFDKDQIYSNKVYRDLCELDSIGGLRVPLSVLARYLATHSNLSQSYASLYQQLKRYRNEFGR